MTPFGFGVAPLFVLSGVGMYFRLARAGAGSFLGVGTGIGDIGGRFLNISARGCEGVMGLCGGSCSSMSTSMISTISSCVVWAAVCLGPGGVEGILASASPSSLSEHKEGVVRVDNEEWFGRDGSMRKTFEFVEEEDPWDDVLVSDWT
jgi:hypothetical protein